MKRMMLLVTVLSVLPLFVQARTAMKPAMKPTGRAFGLNPQAKSVLSYKELNILDANARVSVNDTLGSQSLGKDAKNDVKEAFKLLPEAAPQVGEKAAVESLAVAIAKSGTWDKGSRQRVLDFTRSLTDGVNKEEKKMLEQVKENCRL